MGMVYRRGPRWRVMEGPWSLRRGGLVMLVE
jgi:hypothetical protein